MEDPDYLRSSDPNLAGWLASRGFQVSEIQPPDPDDYPQFSSFVFERTDELDDALAEWAAGPPVEADLGRFVSERQRLLREAREVQG